MATDSITHAKLIKAGFDFEPLRGYDGRPEDRKRKDFIYAFRTGRLHLFIEHDFKKGFLSMAYTVGLNPVINMTFPDYLTLVRFLEILKQYKHNQANT